MATVPNSEAQREQFLAERESWKNSTENYGGASMPAKIDNYNAKCKNVTGEWTGGLAEDNRCAQMSSEIDQARVMLDQRQAGFDQRLYEYNKEWLPAPSYTEQIQQEQNALDNAWTQFNAHVDSHNALCVG